MLVFGVSREGNSLLGNIDLDGNCKSKIFLREVGRDFVDLFNLIQYLGAGKWLFLKG